MRGLRFLRRRHWDDERARELQAHLAHEIDDNLARGMTPEQAAIAAHRKLGNSTRIREEIYDFNAIGWLESVRLDFRDALRQLRRRRRVALTIGLLLTIGIGASTAGFAIAYGTLLRPLPYPDADRLMTLWQITDGRREQMSAPDFRDLRAIPALESAAMLWSGRATLTAGPTVDRVTVVETEPPLLPMLGARAALGRLIGEADADRPVTLLSHRLWRTVLHRDPDVVGRVLQVNGRPVTVAGVLADGIEFELPVGGPSPGIAFTVKDVDLWMTIGAGTDLPNTRQTSTFEAVVKLRPQARIGQAQAAADAIAFNLARQYPDTNRGRGFQFVSLGEQMVGARVPAIGVGFASALLILVIACVNAINLSLGELSSRRRDFALREALGAGRSRLVRQVALESAVLAVVAGSAGLVLARVLLQAFVTSLDVPRAQDVRFDLPVALFSVAASFAAAFIARLAPVLRLEGGSAGLRASTTPHARSAPRLRRGLVAVQLAMAMALSLTATLFAASLRVVLQVDPGFADRRTLSARVSAFAGSHPDKADVTRFFADLIARLEAVPGVESAAAGSSLPLSGSTSGSSVTADGQPVPIAQRVAVGWQSVTPGFFETIGMRIRAGRDFVPEDLTGPTHHVVINETLARQLFGEAEPLGRRLHIGPDTPVPDWHEIVGVVADVRHTSLTEAPSPRVYDLYGEHWARTLFIVVRGRGDSAALATVLRREVIALDPGAPVFEVRTLEDLRGAASTQRRLATIIAGGISGASLLLAALGVYGLLAGSVAARTREIAMRRVLGASAGQVMVLVAREALGMAALGTAAGLMLVLAAAQTIQSQLYGVVSTDPGIAGCVSVLLLTIAAASAFGPARRAGRIDPAIMLRVE